MEPRDYGRENVSWFNALNLAALLITLALTGRSVAQEKTANYPKPEIADICQLISVEARRHQIPEDFFARLIWKESRFDHLALSPVGAMGIAQFMPATAKERGLADPNDFRQAIPASASLLKDLKTQFGNLGLAAAAYNAGAGRVNGWLSGSGYLPLETEDYVFDITGDAADRFTERGYQPKLRPLDEKLAFGEACLQLPVILSRTTPMNRIVPKPWGIQIAGNFKQSVAVASLGRLQKKIPTLRKYKAYVQRRKAPYARKSIYAVRIGANSRKEADSICVELRKAGGACIVMRN